MFIELHDFLGRATLVNINAIKAVIALDGKESCDGMTVNSVVEYFHSSDEFRNGTEKFLETYDEIKTMLEFVTDKVI
ncbi:hypothetical protein [Candidatus Enterococcus ferrettii]|uniref:Uncharacterized protein n=1 Tax=Candidatus Enterococcus ferrettii TaxID=2815324 RepID=A0ABV0EKF7_9ENTE|nr:hypothetical protein [Enterococcus sp. 665A]MBO1341865.1 hypothetical protein [Enterococcus sp. 665A]